LINTDGIEDGRELVTVLGIVDHLRISAQNVETALLEPESNVLRELSCSTILKFGKKRRTKN